MLVQLRRLVFVLCCLHIESGASVQSEYWVRPETMDSCPGNVSAESCLTLSELVLANTASFGDNILIQFLHGKHSTNVTGWIDFGRQVKNISISGDGYLGCNESAECSIDIDCTQVKMGFAFISVDSVSFSNIHMLHCGFQLFSKLKQFDIYVSKPDCRLSSFQEPKASIFIANVRHIALSNVAVNYSSGYGLLVIRTMADYAEYITDTITIADSIFSHSNLNHGSIGGNVVIMKPRKIPVNDYKAYITITNVQISHGRGSVCKEASDLHRYLGGGLSIFTVDPVFWHIRISNSSFTENEAHNGAGVHVSLPYTLLRSEIAVSNCLFRDNSAFNGGGFYAAFLNEPEYFDSAMPILRYRYFKMENTKFTNNFAFYGGGVFLDSKFNPHELLSFVLNIQYSIGHCIFRHNQAKKGAALYAKSHMENTLQAINVTLILSDSQVIFNQGGALYMLTLDEGLVEASLIFDIFVHHCLIHGNSGTRGVALYVSKKSLVTSMQSQVTVQDTQITSNMVDSAENSEFIELKYGATVYVEKYFILLSNCTIADNIFRGIYANLSTIIIQGFVDIANNTARGNASYGGGIYLDDTSRSKTDMWCQIRIDEHSTLYLTGNRATGYGGGIAVSFNGSPLKKNCFFGYNNSTAGASNLIPAVTMKDNSADIAGSDLFGGSLDTCKTFKPTRELFSSFFSFEHQNNNISSIASVPHKVCVCPQNLSHSVETCIREHTYSIFPGKLFHIPLIGVGQWNYPAPSVVRARINSENALIEDEYTTQDIGLTCRNVPYKIYAPLKVHTVNMRLVIETAYFQDSFLPTFLITHIEVQILNCPFGFVFNNVSQSCQCSDYHSRAGLECNIETVMIRKHQQSWIGNYSGEIVVHDHCPFAYCNESHLDVDPYNQQEQCDFNRSGVLCGGCRPGHSLTLGTSQCKSDCSNVYLLLLIPFALAGVVLVVLLLKCNLTVSTGTINGLVLYANIVHANQSIFFPLQLQSMASNMYVLSTFIAWLNLDLGIEVCFTESLSAYTRTWLEFVFPVYIWLMVGALILVSRCSITVSRLTGSNTISVLSTLFLLSYTKILRTTFSTFYPAILVTSNGTEHVVWLVDGNFKFTAWPHSLLFTIALLFLALFLLPFTAILLLSPMIQRYSHKRGVHWVAMKIMPLLDAFHGPYKTKYRNWTGVMLLFRLILFVAFASNVFGDQLVNLVVIIIMVSVVFLVWIKVGRVYKKAWINALELFFLANLLILTVLALYFTSTSNVSANSTLVLIMVGSALLVTCCILAYHFIQGLKRLECVKKLIRKVKNTRLLNRDSKPHEDNADDCIQQSRPSRVVTTTVVELRESLLTQSDSD